MRNRFSSGILIAFAAVTMLLLSVGCSDDEQDSSGPVIVLSADEIVRSVPFGVNPQAQWVRVTNGGDGQTSYTATVGGGSNWLRLFNAANDVPDSFLVSITVGNIQAGTYIDTVWVSAPNATNSPLALPVTLEITNVIQVSPTAIEFLANSQGQPPDSVDLVISGQSTSPLDYSLTKNEAWLLLSKTAGMARDTVIVNADISGLVPGIYKDTITVSAPAAESQVDVPVTMILASWLQRNYINPRSLQGVFFFDQLNGLAVGVSENFAGGGQVLTTSDGGVSWSELPTADGLADLDFVNDTTGWVVGANSRIMHTMDRGANWQMQSSPVDSVIFNTVDFIDTANGWVAGNSGVILNTIDGGANWTQQTSTTTQDIKGIFFISPDSGWVVGNSGLILSTADGGTTWVERDWPSDIDFWNVHFTNNLSGWIAGEAGRILHSADGGVTWAALTTPTTETLNALTFSAGGRGWAVGQNGIIIFSEDGTNWTIQPSNVTTQLTDVFFLDEDIGWIVGAEGTILYTTGGGL